MEWSQRARSYCCNGELLKALRKQRGWSQEQLAKEAGYSDRVIRKAEGGRSISVETIRDLAEALDGEESSVCPEDLICDPLALTQGFIAAVYQHRADVITHVRHFLADNVVFRQAGDPNLFPFAGEHLGIDAADQMFKLFFTYLEQPEGWRFEPQYRVSSCGKTVFVTGEEWTHPIGRPLDSPMWVILTFTYEGGKLTAYDGKFDTDYGRRVIKDAVLPNTLEGRSQ